MSTERRINPEQDWQPANPGNRSETNQTQSESATTRLIDYINSTETLFETESAQDLSNASDQIKLLVLSAVNHAMPLLERNTDQLVQEADEFFSFFAASTLESIRVHIPYDNWPDIFDCAIKSEQSGKTMSVENHEDQIKAIQTCITQGNREDILRGLTNGHRGRTNAEINKVALIPYARKLLSQAVADLFS